jgi:hypothetical protein
MQLVINGNSTETEFDPRSLRDLVIVYLPIRTAQPFYLKSMRRRKARTT